MDKPPASTSKDLYVRADQRGHGYGQALLRNLAAIRGRRSYARVDWAVLDWNAPSIAFYRSLGAFPMDDWTGYRLTGDALVDGAGRPRT